MSRNIVICSDGTGQRGGILFDECRSNIYKLYRATRCGPDSDINPDEQFSFYDPGIGTLPKGMGFLGATGQFLYNLVSQATGLGLTDNIIDCYAAILRHWSPGDRIYLFGFSRGAYTVRCVAAVLAHCGVPTQMKDGRPLKRDHATCRAIAKEAVRQVYQHVSSPKDEKYLPQRAALAARFRHQYASGSPDKSNAYPHFVGLFDTVAAIAQPASMIVAGALWVAAVGLLSLGAQYFKGSFWSWCAFFVGLSAVSATVAYLWTHVKVAFGLKEFSWWKTIHLTELRMRFYDTQLNINVGWARHALAIDEARADFDRVPWGTPKEWRRTEKGEPEWFRQLWFAGNHSDVGGSYPESESRLSDISLDWMVGEAEGVPSGLKVDRNVLKLYPSAFGMQHDETRGLAFRFAKKIVRKIKDEAPLHPTVLDRFEADRILQYDIEKPYRPEALRTHKQASRFYETPAASEA
jgi:uncharacterized protein (DUF2235 family)